MVQHGSYPPEGGAEGVTRPAIEASLLPTLFDGHQVGLVATDPDGLVTALTLGAEAMLGYSQADLVGTSFHERVHYQDREGRRRAAADCPIVAAITQARSAYGDGELLIRRDGSVVSVSWAVAPVVIAGTHTGAMLAICDHLDDADGGDRERARTAAAAAANFRLALLAEASHVLNSTDDLRAGLDGLAGLLVPELADWVVVDVVEPGSGAPERAALAHRDPHLAELAQARLGPLPPPRPGSDGALAQILQGGPAVIIDSFPPAEEAEDPLQRARLELFHLLGAEQAITAPLRTRTRTVGAITAVRAGQRRSYTPEDLALVSELGGRAGYAVENTWLLERERLKAEEMQRALLPELPDKVGGLDVAGFYAPAGEASQVGGDWFDAIPLRDGSVALIIGDMVGHDLHAATRMGAVRHKLRAIAGDRMAPPSEVLERLDAVLEQFAPDDIATAIYGRLVGEGDTWSFEWSQAGHLPPLLVLPDGTAEFLTGPADAPLGANRAARRTTGREIRGASMIVLYTDGLVERSGEVIDDGLARLLTAGGLVHRLSPAEVCTALVEQVDPSRRDDVAILVTRLPG